MLTTYTLHAHIQPTFLLDSSGQISKAPSCTTHSLTLGQAAQGHGARLCTHDAKEHVHRLHCQGVTASQGSSADVRSTL